MALSFAGFPHCARKTERGAALGERPLSWLTVDCGRQACLPARQPACGQRPDGTGVSRQNLLLAIYIPQPSHVNQILEIHA